MNKYLLYIAILLTNLLSFSVYAQDLTQAYEITLWNKNIKGIYVENHMETIGFLPVYKNTLDEITMGNVKITYKSFLNIQILESKEDKIKVLLDFKNDNIKYQKEIILNNKEIKDIEDFKIKVEKK